MSVGLALLAALTVAMATLVTIIALAELAHVRRQRDRWRGRAQAYEALCQDRRCRLERALSDFDHVAGHVFHSASPAQETRPG